MEDRKEDAGQGKGCQGEGVFCSFPGTCNTHFQDSPEFGKHILQILLGSLKGEMEAKAKGRGWQG